MLMDPGAATAAPRDRNPYVFIVGCPRSGTTLLQRMLDCHPKLAVANDTHFIPNGIRGLSAGCDPVLTPAMTGRVFNYRRFYRLGLSDAATRRAAAAASTYSEFVSEVFSEFGKAHEKPLAGEKTPDYVKHLSLLHALFPWARFVHIVRDGRDVALSAREWATATKGPGRRDLWRTEPTAVCALWWAGFVRAGRRDAVGLGGARYREVRYEALVTQPAEVLREVSEFLGLHYSPEMLAFHEGKRRREPGLSAKRAWLPATPGLRDWRLQMPPRDLELFEALAGNLLTDLGYERSVTSISRDVAETARQCRKLWTSRESPERRPPHH